ncbi:MAG: hypothetical protein NW200_13925, partial [Hyphomonadaceae bacterium]|nr:hypothetical protein [Hyphomonadaceae bacterium]
GKPSRIAVESAKAQSGVGYLRLQVCADGDAGWPVRERTPSGGHRHSRAAAPYASVNIHTHPFDPGVTHRAVPVAATWIDDATVVIALPDWAGMRAALAAPEGDA